MLTRATARLNREGGAAAPTTSMANGLGQPLNSVQEGVRGGGTLGRTRVAVPGHQGEERHNGSESSERRGSVENGSALSALAVPTGLRDTPQELETVTALQMAMNQRREGSSASGSVSPDRTSPRSGGLERNHSRTRWTSPSPIRQGEHTSARREAETLHTSEFSDGEVEATLRQAEPTHLVARREEGRPETRWEREHVGAVPRSSRRTEASPSRSEDGPEQGRDFREIRVRPIHGHGDEEPSQDRRGQARPEVRDMEYQGPTRVRREEATMREPRDETQSRSQGTRVVEPREVRVEHQPGRGEPWSRSSTPVRGYRRRDRPEAEDYPRSEEDTRTSIQHQTRERTSDEAHLERQPTLEARVRRTRPRPEDDLYEDEGPDHGTMGMLRSLAGQGWTIRIPDHLGQKGMDTVREQLGRGLEGVRVPQPLPPRAPQPRSMNEDHPWPRVDETRYQTRSTDNGRSTRDTDRDRVQSVMEAMEEYVARMLKSTEDREKKYEEALRESREAIAASRRPTPEITTHRGTGGDASDGESNWLTTFTNYTKSNPVHFKGQLPSPFAYGRESLREFKTRYTAFAVASGWSGPNQVSIMSRCLEQRPLDTFLEWIGKGMFADMDVSKMWRLMEEAFSDPGSERRAAKTELAQRRQEKGESILMYEQVFSRLAVKAKMSDEEKVEKWLDNIHPTLSKAIRLLGAEGGDLTFERAVKIARRVDPSEEETHSIPGVSKKAAQTVATEETMAIEAMREVMVADMKRELESQTRQMEERLKRKWEVMERRNEEAIPWYANNPRLSELLCHRCGDPNHKVKHCDWPGGTCEYCGLPNHRAPVCYKRLRAEGTRTLDEGRP